MTCKICGADAWKEAYAGPVREGKWGKFKHMVIYECGVCGVQRLPESQFKTSDFYTSGEYDKTVREPVTDMRPYHKHLDVLLSNTSNMGNVLDMGGGRGYFSRLLETYRNDVGYFSQIQSRDIGEQVTIRPDIITSFNVIEHVFDPLKFMSEAWGLLPKGGEVLICTPNRDNFLMHTSKEFPTFFYRTQHNWYFDGASLLELAKNAGFSECSLAYSQNYGINNIIGWLVQEKPSKDYPTPIRNTEYIDQEWANMAEREGISDTVYVYGKK